MSPRFSLNVNDFKKMALAAAAYAAGVFVVAVLEQLSVSDFGVYQVPAGVVIGGALDAARRYVADTRPRP